ncbi:hypothetical protein [Anaerospora hongkongensis]|uniref:hypothetical protein n=1 Tax=Anaerospora hongkongensis TaxID=244830 RepID=UPI00289CC6AA|nr:hypothetical protein [Anaerospora hongkongensis]
MHRNFVRAAMLLALMIALQSLRLFVPVPPFISLFIIGSAINACLLIALETTGIKAALLLAVLAPVIAFLQQALPLPVFMVPVAVTNICYVLVYQVIATYNRWLSIGIASLTRMAVLYCSSTWAFAIVDLPDRQASILKTAMSWPQLITGIAGGLLCVSIIKRIPLNSKR